MIGCLIAGGLTVFALSRAFHHRRWCGGGWGGGFHHHHHRHGGWSGPGGWERGLGGWERGPEGGFDDGPEWGESLREDRWRSAFGGGPRAWGKRLFIRRVVEHVRATPEQERRIADAFREFRGEIEKVGAGEGRRTRQELAEALRRPTFDGVALGEQFARHDDVLEAARKAWVGLVARVHDALEPEQRGRLAELVDRGPRMSWWR
jgi:hypothetical protein